jgi:hypothetical protein
MQALAERLDAAVGGAVIAQVEMLGFSGLKTVVPPDQGLEGEELIGGGGAQRQVPRAEPLL